MRIELTGSDTASCGDCSVTSRVSPIGKLARKMIAEGVSDTSVVTVYRDGTKCFNDMTLSAWADITTSENDVTSIKHAKYRPFLLHGRDAVSP